MKDKLYKTNHKAFYYIARKTLVSFAFIIGFGISVAIPTTINFISSDPKAGNAQDVSSEEQNNEEDNVTSSIDLLSYN